MKESITLRNELPSKLQSTLDYIRDESNSQPLDEELLMTLTSHSPSSLNELRLRQFARWSRSPYRIDKRFINLTVTLEYYEDDTQSPYQRSDDNKYNDLYQVFAQVDYPALVLLGVPGSGKSTILRHLQLDQSISQLRGEELNISFFVELNRYNQPVGEKILDPDKWLSARWKKLYSKLPPLNKYLQDGRVLLILDGLNEMQHKNTEEYHMLFNLWKGFVDDIINLNNRNRIVFSCRDQDYTANLSHLIPVTQVVLQPMNSSQVHEFLNVYIPSHAHTLKKFGMN